MEFHEACRQAAEALRSVPPGGAPELLVGFDGFVDHIIDVVAKRRSPTDYDDLPTIAAFGERIIGAAGQSMNFELVVRQTKIGGNGPIMARALQGAGDRIHYLGIIGSETPHPVFAEMAATAASVRLLGPPAQTDALEFSDGKLMLGKLTPLDQISYASVVAECGGVDGLRQLLARVDGIATVNWTMSLGMTEIWQRIEAEILPGLRHDRPHWFVDLADPSKRTDADLALALQTLQDLQQHVDIVLGLNGSEARQVAALRGCPWQGGREDTAAAEACAAALRADLGYTCVMVHLTGSAAAADASGSVGVAGFRCAAPRITTGAGDHFNAGFFSSLLAGLSLRDCLLAGGATSGYYVRQGLTPNRAQVADFLADWPQSGS